ncbi:hypothetical protein Q0Z83_053930 [Actinoplanes sichuanensis]|uniref:Uncharacterized protein n=1 Tax=Actinoplanes sichuanensis TaxID=512349 RepID=A0ABW4AS79_9ACTN|nr:hypothetical protein [Actinoplanes sichuanensis]BEL07202.1 hypothetical protein Q0Z83_053930 [Actinoplanes sichuanensis]
MAEDQTVDGLDETRETNTSTLDESWAENEDIVSVPKRCFYDPLTRL